jgi:hypothetical protein
VELLRIFLITDGVGVGDGAGNAGSQAVGHRRLAPSRHSFRNTEPLRANGFSRNTSPALSGIRWAAGK